MCTNTCCVSNLQQQLETKKEEIFNLTNEKQYYKNLYIEWHGYYQEQVEKNKVQQTLVNKTNKAMKLLIQSIKED